MKSQKQRSNTSTTLSLAPLSVEEALTARRQLNLPHVLPHIGMLPA